MDVLRASLAARRVRAVDAAVAYVLTGGSLWLHDELSGLRNRGIPVRVVAGVDMGITSVEALQHLLDVGVEVCAYRARDHAFHGKTAVISDRRGPVEAFVGSGNWTYGGLVLNSEFTSHLVAESAQDRHLLADLTQEIESLRNNARRLASSADLGRATTDFRIPSEVTARLPALAPDSSDLLIEIPQVVRVGPPLRS